MIINCPDCNREVSDQAPVCLGCGRPMAAQAIAAVDPADPVAQTASEPTMAGAFLTGVAGSVIGFVGGICVLLSLLGFALKGPSAPIFLIVGLILLVVGAYCKFSSGQSVRNVR